ncbi:MAG TPA: Gfo/Idh/MocA family oxidoreductase [Bryobacteraceae bacterium]|nr:Gfo/Idh/MocA family oxidoreductase [Bryobacteraceae bacterium]
MSDEKKSFDRRDFLKGASGVGVSLGLAKSAFAGRGAKMSSRIVGANDRIQIGVVGVGGRGSSDARSFERFGEENNNACKVVAVCDVYAKRKRLAAERHKCEGYQDYRELLARSDIDAVVVATPDHWHARVALDAMDRGKDVYCEKPMCHTNEEARMLVNTVKETKRVLQVGSQTTSADQWWQAKKAIAEGMIGKMIMSQGSYHRNSVEGEWNYKIDPEAGPEGKGDNYIDWKTWLGPAPKRPFDADRFFRFRKYWDYSGGIATDLFYHVVAPLNICWDKAQMPLRVSSGGGIYGGPAFEEKREVPDTFNLIADYAEGHCLVLSSSMANSQHIPGLIRGHEGTIIMVEHGMFERPTEFITVRPEVLHRRGEENKPINPNYKFGVKEFTIPVKQRDMMDAHIDNFLHCMRTREKPHLDVETAACANVVINLSVQSYREGKVLFWDEKNWKVSTKAPKTA